MGDPSISTTVWGAVPSIFDTAEISAVASRFAGVGAGDVFYVDSNASGAAIAGKTPDDAFATINAAIDAAAAGDAILVMPGHAESVANATTIIPDKAGLSIIGLGRGARRPTITFTHANGNIPISAANVRLENVLFTTSGAIDVVAGITVPAADVELVNLEYRDASATSQTIDFIVGGAAAARLAVRGLRYFGAAGDAGAAAVSVTAAVDGVVVEGFNIDGTLSAGCIENVTGVATNMVIGPGLGRNRHATQDRVVALGAATTGFVHDVYGRAATHDADGFNNQFVGADMQYYNCLACNLDDEAGGNPKTASAAS